LVFFVIGALNICHKVSCFDFDEFLSTIKLLKADCAKFANICHYKHKNGCHIIFSVNRLPGLKRLVNYRNKLYRLVIFINLSYTSEIAIFSPNLQPALKYILKAFFIWKAVVHEEIFGGNCVGQTLG